MRTNVGVSYRLTIDVILGINFVLVFPGSNSLERQIALLLAKRRQRGFTLTTHVPFVRILHRAKAEQQILTHTTSLLCPVSDSRKKSICVTTLTTQLSSSTHFHGAVNMQQLHPLQRTHSRVRTFL